LALLLHNERRTALRAGLGDGHVRCGEIAVRIPRTAIEHAHPSAPALAHACALHKLAFLALRALDAQGDWPRVLALRIPVAADELAEPSVLFHQASPALGTLLVQRFVRLVRNARPRHQPPRRLAIRVPRARQKRS